MDSINLEVLKAAVKWSESGADTFLATVIRTWGSAPRPVGSMMAIRADGHVRGSVSGGCIEDDLVRQVQSGELRKDLPEILTYGAGNTDDEAYRLRLPCGGTLQIVVESISPRSQLPLLLDAVKQQRLITRRLDLGTGEVSLIAGAQVPELLLDGAQLITVHGPRHRIIIIGAAQLSRHVASIARSLDYEVIVCDPREEYLDEWDIEEIELSREMPDDLIIRLQPDAHTAILALTHDPKLDDMALLEALKSPAFYIGAIGSRANNEKRRQRLRQFDISDAEIANLHGPVGLHLGARTPPEIALAILAEMTAIRHGVPVLQTHAMRNKSSSPGCAVV